MRRLLFPGIAVTLVLGGCSSVTPHLDKAYHRRPKPVAAEPPPVIFAPRPEELKRPAPVKLAPQEELFLGIA